MKLIRNYILETYLSLDLQEAPRSRYTRRGYTRRGYTQDWQAEDRYKELFKKKDNLSDIEKSELDALSQEYKYGTHPEFRMLGTKASKALSTATDFANTVDSVIRIGTVLSNAISAAYEIKTQLKTYLAKRKNAKSFSNITKMAAALSYAYMTKNEVEKRNIILSIKTEPHIQSIHQFRSVLAAEICLNFMAAGLDEHIIPAIQDVLPKYAHTSEIQRIINIRDSVVELTSYVKEQELSFGRNEPRYSRTM